MPSQPPASRRPEAADAPSIGARSRARTLEQPEELVRVARRLERGRLRDRAAQDELAEGLLHRLHAAARARLHDRVDLLELALPDQVADGVVGDQDLGRRDAPRPVGGRKQGLGDDAFEAGRELRTHLALLLRREDVDDPVDRSGRAARVQRREDQVARLGRGQSGRDRLEIAHLAEEDHVGVLAEAGAKGLGEAARVGADLALVDEAAAVAVEELDRVLDCQDVPRPVAVDLVDHRGERRRLPRPRRAGDQDEATRALGHLVQAGREAQLFEREDLVGDQAEHGAHGAPLEEDVDAEAGEAGDRVREIDLALDLETLLLLRRQDAIEELLGLLTGERRAVLEDAQLAAHADERRRTRGDVQVRRAQGLHAPE